MALQVLAMYGHAALRPWKLSCLGRLDVLVANGLCGAGELACGNGRSDLWQRDMDEGALRNPRLLITYTCPNPLAHLPILTHINTLNSRGHSNRDPTFTYRNNTIQENNTPHTHTHIHTHTNY